LKTDKITLLSPDRGTLANKRATALHSMCSLFKLLYCQSCSLSRLSDRDCKSDATYFTTRFRMHLSLLE